MYLCCTSGVRIISATNYDQLSFGDTTAQDVKSRVDSIARQVIAIRKLEENPDIVFIMAERDFPKEFECNYGKDDPRNVRCAGTNR